MKYKKSEVKQMKSHMFKRDSWLNAKTKVKDKKCSECKRLYSDIKNENIGLLIPINSSNEHLCQDCIEKYIELGVEDIYIRANKTKIEKDELINDIISAIEATEYKEKRLRNEIKEYSIEKLTEKLNIEVENKRMRDYISSIDTSNWHLDEYLTTQYNVIMDKKYLKHESQIENYFNELIYDYLDCGQGYYEDSCIKTICIGDKFYDVTMVAEIGSAKQDRGDRLYWVEDIESVTYKEITKPIEKTKNLYSYSFVVSLLDEEKSSLDKILEAYKINHTQ